jgi:hypothetical protein
VSEKDPEAGSYSSATKSPELVLPPTMSTLPLLSSVAVGPVRAWCMLPVAENVLLTGS